MTRSIPLYRVYCVFRTREMTDTNAKSEGIERKLTNAQKASIERNRQKALLLREAKQKRKLFQNEKLEHT